ncbi:hypothetical protein [Vibrio natriegens]|uniref:hypothetical protein n=1 Tax=Vibrio natriegens TaxID=691 RepID=UPI00390AC720
MLITLCVFCSSTFAVSTETPLTTVRVLEYIDKTGKSYNVVVRRLLVNNISYLVEQISKSSKENEKDFEYLSNIETRDTGETINNPQKDPMKYWSEAHIPTLVLLYGEVYEIGNSTAANSTIFIGSLPSWGDSLHKINRFRVPLDLQLNSFDNLANSHSYITAYALLLDAIRRDEPVHVQSALVNACNQISDRLKADLYWTAELNDVALTVDTISKHLRGL